MGFVVLVHDFGEIVVVLVVNRFKLVKLLKDVESSERLVEFVGIGVEKLDSSNDSVLRSIHIEIVADKEDSKNIGH